VVVSNYQCQNQKIDFRIMRKKLSTEVKSEKDFKKIYHPSHNFLVNYMETKQTYWLFGSYESCKIYREYSNLKFGIRELALLIINRKERDYKIHFYNPIDENAEKKLLEASSPWKYYEEISKELHNEIEKLS